MLWSGVGLLTVALIVVSRTRWGQARPTSKCVVLSVFAHLLLIGYAYKTQLFDVCPSSSVGESIRVTLVSDGPTDDVREDDPTGKKPWDRFLTPTLSDPGQIHPDRETVEDGLTEIKREPTDVAAMTIVPTVVEIDDRVALNDPSAAPLATDPESFASNTQEVIQAAPVDAPVMQNTETHAASDDHENVVDPLTTAPPTRTEVLDAGDLTKRDAQIPELPRTSQDVAELIQRLADLPNTPDNAELEHHPNESLEAAAQNGQDKQSLDQSNMVDFENAKLGPNSRPPASAAPMAMGENVATTEAISGQAKVTRPADGSPLPPIYESRVKGDRDETVRAGGGTMLTEAAVEFALGWLVRNQNASGGWDASLFGSGRETRVLGHDRGGAGAESDTGVSGLALLAFLGAGHTHYTGKHRETAQKGLEFLLSQQRDGNLGGNARTFAKMYCHSIALFAVCEAYAMTGDARIEPYAQQAVAYSVAAQSPGDGGWRYRPGDLGDMSQFGWQVMALKSAQLAGLDLPPVTEERMRGFLERCMSESHHGRSSYRPGEFPSRTMTAEAMLCRLFLYPKPDLTALEGASRYVSEQLPGEGKSNLYYWYYATLALQQLGGDRWTRWNAALQETLLSSQRRSGQLAGSWDADTVWGSYGGRVYSTAMATLCLEAYYRYSAGAAGFRQARRGR